MTASERFRSAWEAVAAYAPGLRPSEALVKLALSGLAIVLGVAAMVFGRGGITWLARRVPGQATAEKHVRMGRMARTPQPEFADRILEPIEVVGVDNLADRGVRLKARIKTKPIEQWAVGREYNRRIKLAFDAAGIEFPFPHMKVVLPEAQISELVRH